MLSHQGDGAGGRVKLIEVERDPDGTLRLRGEPLREHPATLLALLDAAAERAPERAFLVERDARDVWHQVDFRTVAARSYRIGAALRALGASEKRPVMILSGNGIDHALVTFGALRAGIPVVPVSARTGLAARDGFVRLREIAGAVRPGVVFARDGAAYAAAVRAVAPDAAYVTVTEPPPGTGAVDYARLLTHAPLATDGRGRIDGEMVAKVLFVSGSAGETKGVVVTHEMIGALLQSVAQAWPFLDEHPPTLVDWLPWSHGLGGNLVLGIALRHAGTLYVDDGDPTPARFERTARLRAEIPPTLAFDVPLGWTAWAQRLRADDALRRRWLSQLDRACWAGATLAPATRDALRAIGVPLAAAWGSTETSPAVALTTDVEPVYDALGVPLAGVELKLIPSGDAYEARVRGAQVMQGYFWRPDLTAAAFDDEGFYRMGDVVRPVDARAPQRGLAFVSRVDERFKLASGVWVLAGELRAAFLAECNDAADVVVSSAGRDVVGLLVWPTAEGRLLDRDVLRAQVADAMRRLARGDGPAVRPRRALIVDERFGA
ncbi:MAG TPA: AMP-binding protein, partial [Xanthomonadales bacterium]|nr:AMP-binding protein [Xanthomonadales bacterium]